jgi:hypothetical protein
VIVFAWVDGCHYVLHYTEIPQEMLPETFSRPVVIGHFLCAAMSMASCKAFSKLLTEAWPVPAKSRAVP